MLKPISSLAFLAVIAALGGPPAVAEPVMQGPYAADALSIVGFAGPLTIETGAFDGIRLWLDGPAEKRDAVEIREHEGTLIVETPRSQHTSVTVVGNTTVTVSGGGTAQVIIGGVDMSNEESEPVTLRVQMPPDVAVDISGYVGTATLGDLDAPLSVELFSGEIRAGSAIDCTLIVRGAGTILVATATGDRLDMVLDGSGSIAVEAGSVQELNGTISGSGQLSFGGRADRAKIDINGVGTAALGHVDQRPQVAINGVGSVDVGNW